MIPPHIFREYDIRGLHETELTDEVDGGVGRAFRSLVARDVAGVVALISVSLGLKGSLDHYMEASSASLVVFSGQAADLVFSTVTLDDKGRCAPARLVLFGVGATAVRARKAEQMPAGERPDAALRSAFWYSPGVSAPA